jgi:hypothetical protein
LPLLQSGCEALILEVGRKNQPRDEFSDLLIANLGQHKVTAPVLFSH